jgi:S1-C subfamily serine protease
MASDIELDVNGKMVKAIQIYSDEFEDIAIFKTETNCTSLGVGNEYKDGDICTIFAFPLGEYCKSSATIIDSDYLIDGKTQILIHAPSVKAGSSGGALVLKGKIIGIIVSTTDNGNAFAIPIRLEKLWK